MKPTNFGALAIRAALDRSGLEPDDVDEVVVGQCGQVGPDTYDARRCTLAPNIPPYATAMTVNRL